MAETDLISRQAAIRRYCGEHCGCEPQDCGLTMLQDGSEDCDFVRFLKEEPSRDIAPSAQPEIKPIEYRDCANAMLRMWMDNVVTDGEYNRIMDKLNAHWGMKNE